MTRWTKVTLSILGVVVVAVLAFTIFEPIQVLPRIRLAPGFSMVEADGTSLTSEDLRGSIVLYHFTHLSCGDDCDTAEQTMEEIARRSVDVDLGGANFEIVTVSFDPELDTPQAMREYAQQRAWPQNWHVATSDNQDLLKTVIGSGFRVWYEPQDEGGFQFDPVFVLVDGWGVIRGEYRYQVLADDADRITRHLGILGEELRNSDGAATLAYEAAHLFLCYP